MQQPETFAEGRQVNISVGGSQQTRKKNISQRYISSSISSIDSIDRFWSRRLFVFLLKSATVCPLWCV